MDKQTQPISCSLPPSNQASKKPSMACKEGAEEPPAPSAPADDFEFCILSSGGLAPAGGRDDGADMCVADEVFSGGKLLPLRLSSADASTLLLLRSDSLDGAATAASTSTTTSSSSGSGFSSRSVSRSSSSCVSRSTSSNSASSSDHAAAVPGSSSSPSSKKSASSAAVSHALPPRRSMSSNVFYAHPSPSPRPLPPRRSRTYSAPASAAARRSTGSAPPASWGVIRLGVVGAPEVYAPRPAEHRKAAAARSGSRSRSARFELQHRTEPAPPPDKKLAALGLLGAGLVCSCSPDAVVAPVGSAEVTAAAEARRRRKKAEEKKRAATATAKQSGKGTARRSRILEWLEDLSISKFQGEDRRVFV